MTLIMVSNPLNGALSHMPDRISPATAPDHSFAFAALESQSGAVKSPWPWAFG